MRIRIRGAGLLFVVEALLPGCALVTVPVKAVGSLAETVVTTTGDIVTAPFGGSGKGEESKEPAEAESKP